MRQFIAIMCLVLLGACTTQSGNYTAMSEANNSLMATDAVRKITSLYPPASTHIDLVRAANDPYGRGLENKLRMCGYAVQQKSDFSDAWASVANAFTPDSKPEATKPTKKKTSKAASGAESRHVVVSYIVDRVDANLYRVTLKLDARVLSRVYSVSKNHFSPAASWAMKG